MFLRKYINWSNISFSIFIFPNVRFALDPLAGRMFETAALTKGGKVPEL